MKEPRKILFVLLIAYIIVLAVNFAANYNNYAAGNEWRFSVFFSLSVTTFGVIGGTLLFHLVFKKFNWIEKPTFKLLLVVVIYAVYGFAIMFFAMKITSWLFHVNFQYNNDYVINAIYSIMISIIIGLIMSGRGFLLHLKKSIEDNERIKQEMIQSQYEILKSQVNPHFLFNSLNTLTVMIPQQPDVAVSFVEQMAKVFRYSLQHGSEHTIDIATELKVVRAYLFLNEQRFDGKLKVDINIDDAALQKKIITQSLLMLVENAIKHNEISGENPLSVSIYNEPEYLIVKNTLQRKSIPEHSTKVGLENIKKRYSLTTNIPVTISEQNNLFMVKIPLLK